MAGPSARSTQNRWSSVHTEPCHQIVASTGAAAASASHGPRPRPAGRCSRRRCRRLRMPIANSAARSGGDWITNVSRRATCGPTIPTAATTSVTAATMATRAPAAGPSAAAAGTGGRAGPRRRSTRTRALGLGAPTMFCTSRPLTRTDFASGTPCPGCGTTSHATARLKASAAQYAGRMRRARRRANRGDAVEPPAVAGRREGQREAGQHDEHDDREAPVDEPAGPERRVVDRVAGKGAQEDVVHHDEQRGQAADAVEAGQPLATGTTAD